MSKKYSIEEVEKQARAIHGNKYEYDFSTYRSKNLKMRMICHEKDEYGVEHGEFWLSMENHTKKNPCGCKKCAIEKKSSRSRLSVNEINKRLKIINDGLYYLPNDTIYKTNAQKLKFICRKHGEFEACTNNILKGERCPDCRKEFLSKKYSMGLDAFKKKLYEVHGEKIETLEDSIYINNSTKIKLYCHETDKNGNEHGVFWAIPYNILSGRGCKKCRQKKLSEKHLKSYEDFVKEAKTVHGDKFVYDKKSYVDTHSNMNIYCNLHGWFKQSPHSHLSGRGCPICQENNMEREIRLFLEKEGINKIREKTFEWLKSSSYLYLDFYLPDYNIAIECQGEQHFKPVEHFDKHCDNLEIRQLRDSIKYNLCKKHGIKIFYYTNLNCYDKFFGEKLFHSKEELLKEIKKI